MTLGLAARRTSPDQATSEWLLSLDADGASPRAPGAHRPHRARMAPAGYRSRQEHLLGCLSSWRPHPDYQLASSAGLPGFVDSAVHELQVRTRRDVAEPLLHHSYRGLGISSPARTDTPACGPRDRGRGGRAGLGDGAPALGRFLSMYVLRRGFLDGWRGFVLAVLYANYVFSVRPRPGKAPASEGDQRRHDRQTAGTPACARRGTSISATIWALDNWVRSRTSTTASISSRTGTPSRRTPEQRPGPEARSRWRRLARGGARSRAERCRPVTSPSTPSST